MNVAQHMLGLALLAMAGCATASGETPDGGDAASLAEIRNAIFTPSCASCHGGPAPAAGLDLSADDLCSQLVSSSSCLFPDSMRVVPGDPDSSFLVDKLVGRGLDRTSITGCSVTNLQMPLGEPPLAPAQIARIESWIASGTPECTGSPDGDRPDGGGQVADIATLEAADDAVLAGTTVEVRVTLTGPAPSGGQVVTIEVADSTVLAAPSDVFVDGGLSEATFEVMAGRPARPSGILARAGLASAETAIAVTGLELAEILYDLPSFDDSQEWVRLVNRSEVAVDLAAYTLGAGRTAYTFSLTQLAGEIPAGGCFVVGGPVSDAVNGSPVYDQVFDFDPDLVNGSSDSGQAAGFALFDVPIDGVSTTGLPFDAVLCGEANPGGLLGPDGRPAVPTCPDVIDGQSVERVGPEWVAGAPSPNDCSL